MRTRGLLIVVLAVGVLADAAERFLPFVPPSVWWFPMTLVLGLVVAGVSRLAYAYAAADRVDDCERVWLESREQLANQRPDRDPDWMYYLTPNHLDCQAGYALISAGRRKITNGAGTEGKALLRKGEALLRSGAYARRPDAPYQRRALYEGAWLAIGYTAHGKLDDACAVTRMAIPRLSQVRSPRSADLLRTLAGEMRRRKRHHAVAETLPALQTALAGTADATRSST